MLLQKNGIDYFSLISSVTIAAEELSCHKIRRLAARATVANSIDQNTITKIEKSDGYRLCQV